MGIASAGERPGSPSFGPRTPSFGPWTPRQHKTGAASRRSWQSPLRQGSVPYRAAMPARVSPLMFPARGLHSRFSTPRDRSAINGSAPSSPRISRETVAAVTACIFPPETLARMRPSQPTPLGAELQYPYGWDRMGNVFALISCRQVMQPMPRSRYRGSGIARAEAPDAAFNPAAQGAMKP